MAKDAELSRGSTPRPRDDSFPMNWKAPMRLPVILVSAAFTLAGCNANQTLNSSAPKALGAVYPDYNPYNPIEYGQTSGFYGGR